MTILTESTLTVNLWPNGEFGVGRTKPTEDFVSPQIDRAVDEFVSTALSVHGYATTKEFVDEFGEDLPVPLGLSSVANSHTEVQPRARRGTHGITSYGQKFVRNAAFLMEQRGGRELCSFLTVTLPTLTEDEFDSMEAGWAEFVRQYIQKLGRRLERAGLPRRVVYVVEIQEDRWDEYGLPYPHLHVLFIGRKRRQDWAIKTWEFDEILRSTADNVWDWASEKSWATASNVQRVKHSCQGYLGKYMSKGAKVFRAGTEKGRRLPHVSSWWGVGGKLKRYIKRMMVNLSREAADTFHQYVSTACPGVEFYRPLYLEYYGEGVEKSGIPQTWIGAYGRVEYDQVEWWRVLGACERASLA